MFRRTTAILATSGLAALAVMGPASAQDPALSSYGAGAQATALQIELAGQFEAAFSVTGAAVSGEPAKAAANGAAALITGASEDMTTSSTPGGAATAEDCVLDEELPDPINLAALELACVTMATAATPTGTSESAEIDLDVTAANALDQLTEGLAPVLDQILAGLDPLLAEIGASETVAELVDTVLLNLEGGDTLATVQLAPTSSEASKVTGRGEAQGVVVSLLPDLQLLDGSTPVTVGPLATITLGDAFAQATYDAATGQVVTDGKAAIISVDLAGLQALVDALIVDVETLLEGILPPEVTEPLLGTILAPVIEGVQTLLQALDTEIESNVNVTVDQLSCTDANPLAPILCFTVGGVNELDAAQAAALGYDYGPTTRGIEAEVLDLALLSALGDAPLLGLRVGGASAAAAGAPVTPAAPELPRAAGPLPKTGGESALPLTLGLLAVAAAGGVLVRRSRAV